MRDVRQENVVLLPLQYVPLLLLLLLLCWVLSVRLRLMDHILSRSQNDASVQGETEEGGRGKGGVVKEGKQKGDGDREVEGEKKGGE